MRPDKLLIPLIAMILLSCNVSNSSPPTPRGMPNDAESKNDVYLRQFVTGGWVSPHEEEKASPFSTELRAFVITDQAQLENYFNGYITIRSRGTTTSLSRVDFNDSVLLAAYFLWRPLQGDPLSFVGFSIAGTQALVQLELLESPQGKEYPYMFAPMEVISVERSAFPDKQFIEFDFHVNGESMAIVVEPVN
jgi:hypothetical protein